MKGPEWPLSLVAVYLLVVLKVGPSLMATRKPFNLRFPILLYNVFQVVFSSWWVIKALSIGYIEHFFDYSCRRIPLAEVPAVYDGWNKITWYYLTVKYIEFLDTLFFVLRKKQNQVSFLHVYHHTNMAIFTWIFVRYVRGPEMFVIGVTNTFVHVVMYTYYLLAGFGPAVQKYLWWKKYITKLQLAQFVMLILYFVVLLLIPDCKVPAGMLTFSIGNTFSFLALFALFYKNAYNKPAQKAD